MKFSLLIVGIVLSLQISGQQSDQILQELEKLGLCSYFDIISSTVEVNTLVPDWKTYHFDTNDCKCVFGQEYFVFAKDNDGKNNNLVFALQGGGACWPGMENMCKEEVTEEDVYNAEYHYHHENSPVKDWNSIFVPYCDGSVHMGDHAADQVSISGSRNLCDE